MSRAGGPNHNLWREAGYKKEKNENTKKSVARCLVCRKILANTAVARLKAHRLFFNMYLFRILDKTTGHLNKFYMCHQAGPSKGFYIGCFRRFYIESFNEILK